MKWEDPGGTIAIGKKKQNHKDGSAYPDVGYGSG